MEISTISAALSGVKAAKDLCNGLLDVSKKLNSIPLTTQIIELHKVILDLQEKTFALQKKINDLETKNQKLKLERDNAKTNATTKTKIANDKLSEETIRVLGFIVGHRFTHSSRLIIESGLTETAVEYHLAILGKKGFVTRVIKPYGTEISARDAGRIAYEELKR